MAELLKLGSCGVCNKVKIWEKKNGRIVQTKEYAEFSFVLSDDMIYRHAACRKCIVELNDVKVKALVDRIKEHWAEEMVGWATKRNFATMRALEVKAYDQDEKVALREFKQKKQEDFEIHLAEVKIQKQIASKLKKGSK